MVWIVLLVIIALVLVFIATYNRLVVARNAFKNAFAQIDVQLTRRYDLIPNLVETVKGFAKQELTVFDDVAKARSALLSAGTPREKIAANQQLDGAMVKFLALKESYPELKSNENFLRLQDELAGTENRIAVERMRFNETVQAYNSLVKTVPTSFIARLGGFTPSEAYFKASEAAQTAPAVKF